MWVNPDEPFMPVLATFGPVGEIAAWPTNIAPENWLLLDGAAHSRTRYPDLFALIGTSFGAGDGSTTFNLPDGKGREIIGRDATQVEFDTLGEIGGAKTHILTAAQQPALTGDIIFHGSGAASHPYQLSGTAFSAQVAHANSYKDGGTTLTGFPSIGTVRFNNGGTRSGPSDSRPLHCSQLDHPSQNWIGC